MKQKSLFHIIIATGFGTGFSPFAPGTVGAVLATIIWLIIAFLAPSYLLLTTISFIVVFTALGIWSSNVLEAEWGEDSSKIVVDEMVGVWIALLAVDTGNLYYALIAFVLFRLFDIYKPLGIRKMENFKGGLGVMLDDIVAGVYSFLILLGLKWLIG